MTIAIDASRAVKAQPTGTEVYSARIIEYLAKVDKTNNYILYSPSKPTGTLSALPANFQWRIIPLPRLWSQLRLPFALMQDKPDVLFVPSHVLPLLYRGKSIVTIHDLAGQIFPGAYPYYERIYNTFTTKLALSRARAIITPSKSTKSDLIKIYGANSFKITPIHHGFDHRPTKTNQNSVKLKKYQPYFLMLGRLETRKNTRLAIEAWGQLRTRYPDIKVKLLLIGKPGFGYGEVAAAKHDLPKAIRKDVFELGYLADREVETFMQKAIGFLYPSLYEGFGLPILEAMAAGTPVITADAASSPEVAGEAAILVNPNSANELVDAMRLIATDALTRRQLRERGRDRVKSFSWLVAAKETLGVIEKVVRS